MIASSILRGVFSLASSRLRRVNLSEQWLNLLPKVIRYFSDPIKRILFGHIGCSTSTEFCLLIA